MTRHKLLEPEEVAEWIGVSVATLATWRSRPPENLKPLPYLPVGRRIQYREDQVQKWIESNTHTPDSWAATTAARYRRRA